MVWVAYYYDASGIAVFSDELEARRYADDGRTSQVPFGTDLIEALGITP